MDRVLAEGVCESIAHTTPRSRHRHPHPRFSFAALFGWTTVAGIALFVLAIASALGR